MSGAQRLGTWNNDSAYEIARWSAGRPRPAKLFDVNNVESAEMPLSVGGGDAAVNTVVFRGRFFCSSLFSLLQAQSSVRGQTSIANLVEQRAIADAQCARRLFAVPVVMLQHLQDHLSLELAYALPGELLQRNRSIQRDFGTGKVGLALHQIGRDHFLMAQDDVALDQIFQFANITRPVIFLQDREHFVR